MTKDILRRSAHDRLSTLTHDYQLHASQCIVDHIQGAPFLAECHTIACFASLESEPNLNAFYRRALNNGCQLLFPKYTGQCYSLAPISDLSQLQKGTFNVLEPTSDIISSPSVDLWLIPGLFFDLLGTRIGRGHGYYDRLLTDKSGLKCGLCFHTQLSTRPLPKDSHDIAMDVLISEHQMYVTMGL